MEIRRFSVHPSMIFNLISAQAGSLGKAVLENVMNSIDAKATKVEITVNATQIKIVDDGHGFRSKEEIGAFFDVFGFPHESGARTYGQFGIGRAQLWSFATAVWYTNTFKMDVDIKKTGLDYTLVEDQPFVPGLTIVSKFYKKQTTKDLLDLKNELKLLARFAQIPVLFNGEQINESTDQIAWNIDTPDAFIRLTDTSSLTVYNLGVLVKSFPANLVGSGGLVVTKPGVTLALNMARNDILVAECKVWGRIRPLIQKKSDERVRTTRKRLTSHEANNLATRYLAGEVAYETVAALPLIKDVHGKSYTLEKFARQVVDAHNGKLVVSERGEQKAQRVHSTKLAFVLSAETLAVFDCPTSDLSKFVSTLADRMASDCGYKSFVSRFKTLTEVFSSVHLAAPTLNDTHSLLATSEQTPSQSILLRALDGIQRRLDARVRKLDGTFSRGTRTLRVGNSDVSAAWTDSSSYIAFEEKQLELANQGLSGMSALVALLLHELVHHEDSAGSHVHDVDFYKTYHDCVRLPLFGELCLEAYRTYVQLMLNAGLKVGGRVLKDLTSLELLEVKEASPRGKYFNAAEQLA